MVIYVVKNASRPVSGEDSPVPDGKRLAFLCGVYCNSADGVMQVVSAKAAAQMLSRNKQRIGRKVAVLSLFSEYKALNTGIIVRDLWHSLLTIPLFFDII